MFGSRLEIDLGCICFMLNDQGGNATRYHGCHDQYVEWHDVGWMKSEA